MDFQLATGTSSATSEADDFAVLVRHVAAPLLTIHTVSDFF
jgi:hypothetical protein